MTTTTERKGSQWYTSQLDCGGISYWCLRPEGGEGVGLTVQRVIFDRFNVAAGVRERVSVHWSEAFRWADFDPCGGMGVSMVELSDGSKCFASGMYYGTGHKDEYTREQSGLAEVIVGCYGSPWLKRAKRPKRDQHGFAIRAMVV